MIKQTAAAIATAAVIGIAGLVGGAHEAEAGVKVYLGGPGIYVGPAPYYGGYWGGGFYYGPTWHPRFYVRADAPYHCHRWRDKYHRWHKRCHRHY